MKANFNSQQNRTLWKEIVAEYASNLERKEIEHFDSFDIQTEKALVIMKWTHRNLSPTETLKQYKTNMKQNEKVKTVAMKQ